MKKFLGSLAMFCLFTFALTAQQQVKAAPHMDKVENAEAIKVTVENSDKTTEVKEKMTEKEATAKAHTTKSTCANADKSCCKNGVCTKTGEACCKNKMVQATNSKSCTKTKAACCKKTKAACSKSQKASVTTKTTKKLAVQK